MLIPKIKYVLLGQLIKKQYLCALKYAHFFDMKILLRYICLAVFLLAVQFAAAQNRHHLVRPGQTLYSISKQYEVTVEDILAANPSITDVSAVPTGTLLTIPPAGYADQKPAAPATTQQQTKPASQSLIDVLHSAWTSLVGETEDNSYKKAGKEKMISVILPFYLNTTKQEEKKLQMRYVEFYEGMLLAVDKMQQAGQHITLNVYDLGTKPMSEILADPALASSDLIVAPMETSDVRMIASYANGRGIPVLSSFGYSAELCSQYKTLIQLNTPKNLLYPQLCDDIVGRFGDYSFVFLNDSLQTQKTEGLIDPLREQLKQRNIPCHDFYFGHNTLPVERVDSVLGLTTDKVVYVPVSAQKNTLQRLFPALKNQLDYQRTAEILTGDRAVIGYPEWQLLASEMINDFYDLNVFMFSKLYINPFDEEVRNFYDGFKNWYHKDLMNIVPKYGLLGYDVTCFFLSAMGQYGKNYLASLPQVTSQTLQTMMRFEQVSDGGYINRGLYLVHFCPDSKIEKYEIH